jgi:GNAT superfamily N-acetyltransferase
MGTCESAPEHVAGQVTSNMLLRPAEPDDAMDVAHVHVRSWQMAYRNLLPDEYLNQLRPEERCQRYTFGSTDPREPATIVATVSGSVCGFVTTAPAQDAADLGELCALYVDPEYWGHGFGTALVSTARARLLHLGFRNAILWVLERNVRAERFYQNNQWKPDGTRRTQAVWGLTVNEVRYWRALDAEGRS